MKRIWYDTISINQEISIYNEKYICKGIALYESNNENFCELILYNKIKNEYRYLEIKLIDKYSYEFYLYSKIYINEYNMLLNNTFSNAESYTDKAKIINYKGDFDADINESCRYTEHYSDDKILSVEDWDFDIEYSLGEKLLLEDIVLGEVIKDRSKKVDFSSKKPSLIVMLVVILFFAISLIPSRAFVSYCSPTCTRYDKDWCCQNVNKCKVTNKKCKSMYYSNSNSIRNSSYGSRNPVGGGTSFGK